MDSGFTFDVGWAEKWEGGDSEDNLLIDWALSKWIRSRDVSSHSPSAVPPILCFNYTKTNQYTLPAGEIEVQFCNAWLFWRMLLKNRFEGIDWICRIWIEPVSVYWPSLNRHGILRIEIKSFWIESLKKFLYRGTSIEMAHSIKMMINDKTMKWMSRTFDIENDDLTSFASRMTRQRWVDWTVDVVPSIDKSYKSVTGPVRLIVLVLLLLLLVLLLLDNNFGDVIWICVANCGFIDGEHSECAAFRRAEWVTVTMLFNSGPFPCDGGWPPRCRLFTKCSNLNERYSKIILDSSSSIPLII